VTPPTPDNLRRVDLELTGRRAVITGGSRGIGLAIGRALAAEGADVALVARTEDVLARAAQDVARESGRTVIAVPADTGDDASVATMVGLVVAQLGGVDILVNAAATPATGAPFSDDNLEAEINVKVRGYLRCARAVAPLMVESGWGRIINIAGLAARQTGNLVGTVRNVAVAALTKNLADELGPRGVNVTVVHPGMTRTERTAEAAVAMASARGVTVEELELALERAVSIGRIVTAEEVAAVVTFLASPKSVAINGDPIIAGGGARGSIHY
jgi:NAD(P)-dependent dehydrogenase (short-subunit alcohol dehydrogenase family)